MKKLALALALALSTAQAVPTSLTVWLPERGETATLSAVGLVGKTSGRVVLNRPDYDLPQERPIAGGFARLTQGTGKTPTRLEVVRGGKVTASRTFPEVVNGASLRGTVSGPCLSYDEGGQGVTRCFAPDLKTEWAKLGWILNISQDGRNAYFYDMPKNGRGESYQPDLHLIRQNLTTGEQTPLTYRVPLDAGELEYHAGLAKTYDTGDMIYFGAELPDQKFVVCATVNMPKFYCRLDVVDRDLKRLFSLQGSAYISVPQPTADGKKLFYMGNTLQVWDARTGKRLAHIRDPRWDKQKQVPLRAYLTPNGTQAAILTAGIKNGWPDYQKMTAYVYRVQDGKLLNSFAVRP